MQKHTLTNNFILHCNEFELVFDKLQILSMNRSNEPPEHIRLCIGIAITCKTNNKFLMRLLIHHTDKLIIR